MGAGASAAQPGARVEQAGEQRLARLESLRALAALGVLVGHVWGARYGFGQGARDSLIAADDRVLLRAGDAAGAGARPALARPVRLRPHALLASVPLSLLGAFVSYRLIEAPFLRLRRRWSSSSYSAT